MHESVLAWTAAAVTRSDVAGRRVLEVGSGDVNGTVRPLLEAHEPAEYLGVDAAPGKGVDRVVDCTRLLDEFGPGTWDVVVSTEMLEHVRDWRASIRNLVHVVAPGGLLIVTTRSPGFPFHPFPEDHWRYTVAAMRQIVDNFRLEPLQIMADPEAPGVFVKVRKPEGWRSPRGNPWRGVDVMPVSERGTVMPDDKTAADKASKPDQVREVKKPAAVKNDPRRVAALLRERAGLAAAGKADRVAQVDEQLVLYGYEPDEKQAARKQPPQGRSSKPQQTAAAGD